ncbi:MAG TPA: NAD(P)-dependent oxidoreductase [Verrucomicrobiae bacterium]
MNQPRLVHVTGSAGRIGQAVVKELLARRHRVRGFDCVTTPGLADAVIGSVTDPMAIGRAMRGVEVMIHLAATPDDADVLADLVPNNVVGLFHTLEAARAAGVKRLVLASSGQANDGQQVSGPWPIKATDPITPRYWYAATKMFMESIGSSFARRHGMSVIIARLGWCPRTVEQVREIASEERFKDVYLSPGDAGRFFACAVEAPASVNFEIVYPTSKPFKTARFDLEPARRLGFEPKDTWPQGVEIVLGRPPQAGEV